MMFSKIEAQETVVADASNFLPQAIFYSGSATESLIDSWLSRLLLGQLSLLA